MDCTALISELIEIAGLTQVEIGEACNISQTHVSDLLNGKRKHLNHVAWERLKALHQRRVPSRKRFAARLRSEKRSRAGAG